jgi:ABC-type nitrate/sulfonate/bicarbonate transport system permease component
MTASASALRPVRNPAHRRNRTPLGRFVRRHERGVYGAIGLVAFILFWEFGANAGFVDEFFFSRPSAIALAGINEIQLPRFWNDFKVSAWEFASGYVLAVVLAVPLGIIFGWYRRLSYMADPWLNLINSLPRVALLPLIVLWVGIGIESKITVVFLGAFFSVIIPTVQGVRTVDRRFLDVARSFGASQRLLFTSVVMPATVPFVVTGLRLGVGRALIGVVVGELYAQTEGLGVLITRASSNLQPDRMFFGILIFTFAGIVTVEGLRRVERYFQRWRPAPEER